MGSLKTVILKDETYGGMIEIALQGATLLKFVVSKSEGEFNIIDGYQTQEEMMSTHAARCWIMIPFANRIPNGLYKFNGNTYQLSPVPPRENVIHGFTSNEKYKIKDINIEHDYAEIIFINEQIRYDKYSGYPFALNVYVKYKYEKNKLTIKVIGENVGERPLPFAPGWHPYFKTPSESIEDLILSIDADYLVKTDEDLIPLKGEEGYIDIEQFPNFNFRSNRSKKERAINGRILDVCYAGLRQNGNGYFESSIYDHSNNFKITMFQKEGAIFLYTGDTLDFGKRRSVALEPMKFLTNAFNRNEYSNAVSVMPGHYSEFEFGVKVSD